ncbi:MAG TPA: YkgJ family cysteine cluster protein [Nannocystis sp.]
MVLEVLKSMFGRRIRLPRDQVSKVPRAAKKAAEPQVAAMQAAIDTIAALPDLADVATTKKLPKGFFAAVQALTAAYDAYIAVVVKHTPALQSAARAGTPEGSNGCYEQPVGVTGVEGLAIYRNARLWKDFAPVAQELARLGEQQFKDIQSLHTGKDPEKIGMTSLAVQQGRVDFARRKEHCPLLDRTTLRCKAWEQRPFVCRMHHILDPASADPQAPDWPKQAKVFNVRVPLRQQVALMQIEKRMLLTPAPFLNANILQWLQLAEGHQISEVGEAPLRFAPDGQPPAKANRNRPNAKKFKDKKRK